MQYFLALLSYTLLLALLSYVTGEMSVIDAEALLELSAGTYNTTAIESAYRKRSRLCHPDKCVNDKSGARFLNLTEARDVLIKSLTVQVPDEPRPTSPPRPTKQSQSGKPPGPSPKEADTLSWSKWFRSTAIPTAYSWSQEAWSKATPAAETAAKWTKVAAISSANTAVKCTRWACENAVPIAESAADWSKTAAAASAEAAEKCTRWAYENAAPAAAASAKAAQSWSQWAWSVAASSATLAASWATDKASSTFESASRSWNTPKPRGHR